MPVSRPNCRAVAAAIALLCGVAPLVCAGQPGPAGDQLRASLRIPSQHPYLLITPAEAEKVRQRAKRLPGGSVVLEDLLKRAQATAAHPLGRLPEKGDTEHWGVAARLVEVGLGYALGGDRRLAQWVRDGLVAYADIYPGLPLTRLRCRVFKQSSLFEAMWAENIAQAYDLVADSEAMSAQDRRHVEHDLLRQAVACFMVTNYRYEDVRLDGRTPEWGRQDPGYKLQAATIVASDGGQSQGDRYLLTHAELGDFVLEWTITRLADRGKQNRAFVVFQTNPHNPGVRKYFPVSSYVRETGRRYRFRLEVRDDQAQLACDGKPVATRPSAASSVGDWRWLLYDWPAPDARQAAQNAQATWKDQAVGNAGMFRRGCTLLPSTGLAVLREKEGDFTADRQATCASLSYGPYGGGHGHPDKLNLVVYAQGRQWIPDFGSMPYETHWKKEWTAHTVSHNTLVVDGVSQQPAGEKDHMWPVDSSRARVMGTLEKFDPDARRVAARCESAYPGFVLRREVRLWRHAVVDRFSAEPARGAAGSGTEHQFDYVLHVDGRFEQSSIKMAAQSGPMGAQCGYQLLEKRRAGATSCPASLTFAAADERLRIWVLPQGGAVEVILAEGPTNSPDQRQPVLILRQKGAHVEFRTVIEPVTGAGLDESTVVREAP